MPELFLYRLSLTEAYDDPTAWTDESWKTISEHGAFLERLRDEGHLVMAGRTQYEPGDHRLMGIAIVIADSLEDAEEMMSADPAVVAGIQRSSVHPFSIAIAGFGNMERLK